MAIDSSTRVIDMGAETITINRTIDGKKVSQAEFDTDRDTKGSRDSGQGNKLSKSRLGKALSNMKSDPFIWGIYGMLILIAIVELFSASTTEVSGDNVYAPLIRHGLFLAMGLGIILGLQKVHYGYISRFAFPFFIVSVILLFVANQWGANINGAQRAIMIKGMTIQPAEILKLSAVVVLAMIFGRNQKPLGVSTRGIVLSLIVVTLCALMTIRNGMTNMLIIMVVSASMLLIGGIPWKKIIILALCYFVVGGFGYWVKSMSDDASEFDEVATEQVEPATTGNIYETTKAVDRSDMREGRLKQWWRGVHPTDHIDDYNRQTMLSYMAQARGGIKGHGPGNSRESARLPLAYSDYIYSIIIEDTGLVGGVTLMVIYLSLLARAGVLAYRCKRAFPAFLIMGCAVLIVFQALVHMAIVTGASPVSGQPLPFISKGGTSVLVMSTAIGIMLSVSRFAETNTKQSRKTQKEDLRDLPEDLQASNMTNI